MPWIFRRPHSSRFSEFHLRMAAWTIYNDCEVKYGDRFAIPSWKI
jgi:hypothetical protein